MGNDRRTEPFRRIKLFPHIFFPPQLWRWADESGDFLDVEGFREWYRQQKISEDLRPHLPINDPTALEKPAEAGFRQRMSELAQAIQAIQQRNMTEQEALYNPVQAAARSGNRRQKQTTEQLQRQCQASHIEVVHLVLEACEREPDCIYDWLARAMLQYVLEVRLRECFAVSLLCNAFVS